MNITSKGRYALRMMLELAQHRDEGPISIRTVAERQEISQKYLEAIIPDLKKAGLVESVRGKDGGFRLTRAPEEYSAGEIVRCVEGKLAPVACIRADGVSCERAGGCRTLPMWLELDTVINAYLDGVRLTDLVSGERWKNKESTGDKP